MADSPSQAFEKLHRSVQQWIWQQGWTELRDVQEAAVDPILRGSIDVIIAASTASGKTEAAFLPIGSVLADQSQGDGLVLYISPLKALINDQFKRLQLFFEQLDLPAFPWHGDISPSKKKAFRRTPHGILLITPESLEGMFIRDGLYIHDIFRHLKFVVVDELHSFIGSERGRQLQSLLHRLDLCLERTVPRIGLSATIGDMNLAAEYLRPARPRDVRLLISKAKGQVIKIGVFGYFTQELPVAPAQEGEASAGDSNDSADPIAKDIYTSFRGDTNLVFANSRGEVESYSDRLRKYCEADRLPNEFWPHHGSLSKELREQTEAALKAAFPPATAICTSTLELGIDIGAVKCVGQIGPPFSVASLRQRLGRSGRRNEPALLRVYINEKKPRRIHPIDSLRTPLVQTIAIIELLLQKWCEPPSAGGLHLSTFVHQLLALIAQHGGITPIQVWNALCNDGPFQDIDKEIFKAVLRSMAERDLLVQSSDGTLLPGATGERIVNHYTFTTVFWTPEEYTLVAGTRILGTLPIDRPLKVNSNLIFGGRRWKVIAVDYERKVVQLVVATAGTIPKFSGLGGTVHDRIRKRMKDLYVENRVPEYLNSCAQQLLHEARGAFREFGLEKNSLLSWESSVVFFPWAGDRIVDTLSVQLDQLGFDVTNSGIALTIEDISKDLLGKRLQELVELGPANGIALAEGVANKKSEKFHDFLSDDLLAAEYASSRLDPVGAWETIRGALG